MQVMAGLVANGSLPWPHPSRVYFGLLCVLQFVEIAFITYEGDYKLAALLAAVTLVSCFAATSRLYGSRMKLYQSVAQRRLVPILHAGRVRYAMHPLSSSQQAKCGQTSRLHARII